MHESGGDDRGGPNRRDNVVERLVFTFEPPSRIFPPSRIQNRRWLRFWYFFVDLRCRDSRQHVAFFHFAERPRRSLHFRHHRGESTSFRLAKLDADISRRQFDFKHAPCSSLVSSSERRYRESVSLRLLPVSVFVDIFILEGDGGHACASSRPKDSSPPPRPDIRTYNPRFWRPVLYQLSYTPKVSSTLEYRDFFNKSIEDILISIA